MKYWKYAAFAALLIASPVNAKIIEWAFTSEWFPNDEYRGPRTLAQGALIFDTRNAVITTLRIVSDEFTFENAAPIPYRAWYYDHPDIKGDVAISSYWTTEGLYVSVPQFHIMEVLPGYTIEETMGHPWTIFTVQHEPRSFPDLWTSHDTWGWTLVSIRVPEPSTIALLCLGLAGLIRRQLS